MCCLSLYLIDTLYVKLRIDRCPPTWEMAVHIAAAKISWMVSNFVLSLPTWCLGCLNLDVLVSVPERFLL